MACFMYAPHFEFMSKPFYAEIILQVTVVSIGIKLLISWIPKNFVNYIVGEKLQINVAKT